MRRMGLLRRVQPPQGRPGPCPSKGNSVALAKEGDHPCKPTGRGKFRLFTFDRTTVLSGNGSDCITIGRHLPGKVTCPFCGQGRERYSGERNKLFNQPACRIFLASLAFFQKPQVLNPWSDSLWLRGGGASLKPVPLVGQGPASQQFFFESNQVLLPPLKCPPPSSEVGKAVMTPRSATPGG